MFVVSGPGSDGRNLMQGSITNRTLLEPASLSDALGMLRDEGPLVPMAGCTDLDVALTCH